MDVPEVTVSQMREADRLMSDEFGISVPRMMELAGHVTARLVNDVYKSRRGLVLAGKGNNGGDGMVAARHLHNLGVSVSVILAGEMHSEFSMIHTETLKKIGVPMLEGPDGMAKQKPYLILDALLGYGSNGEPRGSIALLVREAAGLGVPVLALDSPTGFEVSSGKWFTPAFTGCDCITLGLPKQGMIKDTNISRLFVGDIGIPQEVFRKIGLEVPPLFGKGMHFEINNRHG